MLVNLSKVLVKARAEKFAVGSFNIYNYETIRGVFEAGKETGFATIVAFGENYLKNMDCDEVAAVIKIMAQKVKFSVVLHLDHCKSIDTIKTALNAGFTSIMYDGSALPFEENSKKTAEVVSLAHAKGASVEAELGALAKGEFSNEESAEEIYTDPSQAEDFIRSTGIDALAVSIGTVHGMYKGTPKIDIGVLKQIASKTDIPLVLHGGSGTPEEIVKECIHEGIAKINVNTEISVHTLEKMKKLFNEGGNFHLSQLSLNEVTYVKEVVLKYMKMFRVK